MHTQIDKIKFQDFLVKILNKKYETDSFFITNEKDKKYGIDVFSEAKKIAVHFRVEDFKKSEKEIFNSLMSEMKEIFDNTKYSMLEFDKFIIISTYKDDPIIFEYTQLLKNEHKYHFEVDFLGWDSISNYLKENEHLLPKIEKTVKISQFINFCPKIKLAQVVGAEKNAEKIDLELEKGSNIVLYSAIHGTGKSTNILNYIHSKKYQQKYDHIAYIDFVDEIKMSFVNSFKNNKIKFSFNNHYTIFDNISTLFNKLKNIEGTNLLIIDNVTDDNQIVTMSDMLKEINWKILISSNAKISNFINVEIEPFTKNESSKLFNNYYSQKEDEDIINKILVRINHHPFLSSWFAKKLNSDRSLSAEKLYKILQNKDNKTHHFKKYLNINTTYENILWQRRILKYILAVYEYQAGQLSLKEKNYLMILCVLPQKSFSFDELKAILNLNTRDEDYFAETIVNLISNNWLEANNNRFYIQPYVKNILEKKLKPTAKKLKQITTNLINILYNTKADNFSYICFAESVLNSTSKKDSSSANLSFNLAKTYEELGYFNMSQTHFYDAVQIFEDYFYENDPDDKLAENISQIYFKIDDYEKALEYNEVVLELRQEKYEENNVELARTYRAMSLIYDKIEDYESAIENIDNALDIYREIYEEDNEDLLRTISIHEYLSYQYEDVLRRKNRWYWINKYFV